MVGQSIGRKTLYLVNVVWRWRVVEHEVNVDVRTLAQREWAWKLREM